MALVSTCSKSNRGIPGRCVLLLRKTNPWNVATNLCDFQGFRKSKAPDQKPEPGYTKYEPVMFNMDMFRGKTVPCVPHHTNHELGGLSWYGELCADAKSHKLV